MTTRLVIAAIACTIGACKQSAPSSSDNGTPKATPAPGSATGTSGTSWTANGGSACAKYLTPEVMAAILVAPTGQPKQIDAQTCSSGSIYITLKVANVDVFRQEVSRIAFAHPITGIGDAAYWNDAGAVASVKSPDRGCDISVLQGAKSKGEALAQQLGQVCNQLFALP